MIPSFLSFPFSLREKGNGGDEVKRNYLDLTPAYGLPSPFGRGEYY
jgi:hypothetical protein